MRPFASQQQRQDPENAQCATVDSYMIKSLTKL